MPFVTSQTQTAERGIFADLIHIYPFNLHLGCSVVCHRFADCTYIFKAFFGNVEVVECFREEFWNEITPGEYNRLLLLLVEKAVVCEDKLELELKTSGIKSLMEEFKNE